VRSRSGLTPLWAGRTAPHLAGGCHPGPVSQFDDLPPPRRPLFFPVVIATVLLSIIGMSAGLALGSRHETPHQVEDQTPYVPVETGVSPVDCPPQMHATARKLDFDQPMTQVLKVRVDRTGLTVWICQNPAGRLFYQANKGGQDGRWVEGETALFLSDVVQYGDGFLATAADGNTFTVSAKRLVVVRKGAKTTYDVTPE
jgi:hypothetical protein